MNLRSISAKLINSSASSRFINASCSKMRPMLRAAVIGENSSVSQPSLPQAA